MKNDNFLVQKAIFQNQALGRSIDIPISEKRLTPLYKAIRNGSSIDIIRMLLISGADISKLTLGFRNAFHYAMKRADINILKLLISTLFGMVDLSDS